MAIYSTNYMYRARRISNWSSVLRNPVLARARNLGTNFVTLSKQISGYAKLAKKRVDPTLVDPYYVKDSFSISLFNQYNQVDASFSGYSPGPGVTGVNPDPKSAATDPRDVEIYISDERYYGSIKTSPYLILDFVPKDLDYAVETRLQNLGVVGLNYPRYHFGGSEDTLSFTIDWYDYMKHSDRVVEKCRRMEALTKTNGYRKGPPVINIRWGTNNLNPGEPSLFENHFFIVKSATYQLSLFLLNRSKGALFVKNGLKPLMATQRVVLKRVGSQLSHSAIVGKPAEITPSRMGTADILSSAL